MGILTAASASRSTRAALITGLGALLLTSVVATSAAAPAVGVGAGRNSGRVVQAADSSVAAGCDSARPAVAFRFGGQALARQPAARPIPCAVDVGPASESATVGVTGSGKVVAAPLLAKDHPAAPLTLLGPALVGASRDRGASWLSSQPGDPGHVLFVPPWMSVDPRTSRIWFASVLPTLCGTELSWSDDGGRHWQTNPKVGCPGMGSLSVLEGPAPVGGARPAGYPHVVYVCANATDFDVSNLYCYRSLDGGQHFSSVGGFPDPPRQADCDTAHLARPGTVTPDGVLVFSVYACGEISAALSRDEGATWQWHHVASGDVQELYITSLAADRAGNLYLAWLAGPAPEGSPAPLGSDAIQGSGTPVVSISRDAGKTWSKPQSVAPPGVQVARRIAVTARSAGQVTISYLGSTDKGATFSGYLTESDDLLAPRPLLWGAAVNDPAKPLMLGSVTGSFGDRLFYLGNAFGPDGTAWAAFHCVQLAPCSSARSAVIGHLTPAR